MQKKQVIFAVIWFVLSVIGYITTVQAVLDYLDDYIASFYCNTTDLDPSVYAELECSKRPYTGQPAPLKLPFPEGIIAPASILGLLVSPALILRWAYHNRQKLWIKMVGGLIVLYYVGLCGLITLVAIIE